MNDEKGIMGPSEHACRKVLEPSRLAGPVWLGDDREGSSIDKEGEGKAWQLEWCDMGRIMEASTGTRGACPARCEEELVARDARGPAAGPGREEALVSLLLSGLSSVLLQSSRIGATLQGPRSPQSHTGRVSVELKSLLPSSPQTTDVVYGRTK